MSEFRNSLRDVVTPQDMEKMNVLPPDKTRREERWWTAVEKCRELLRDYSNIRQEIAQIAISVCVIHHGGRATHERYTLANFAKQVGVPHKTLCEWVRLYNHILNELPEAAQKTITYTQLRDIDTKLRGADRTVDFDKKVRSAFKEVKKETAIDRKMRKYLKSLRTIHFNVKNPRMMKGCDPTIISEIVSTCRAILVGLEKQDKKKILKS